MGPWSRTAGANGPCSAALAQVRIGGLGGLEADSCVYHVAAIWPGDDRIEVAALRDSGWAVTME